MNRKCTGFVWRLWRPDIRLCCFFSRWRQITLGHVDPLRWAERGHLKMSSVYNGLRGRKLPHFPDSLLFPQEGRRKETELWVGRVGNQGGLAVTPVPSPFLQPPSTHLECCKTHAADLSPSPRTSVSQSQTDFKGRNETDPGSAGWGHLTCHSSDSNNKDGTILNQRRFSLKVQKCVDSKGCWFKKWNSFAGISWPEINHNPFIELTQADVKSLWEH